jgi:outer membrane protein
LIVLTAAFIYSSVSAQVKVAFVDSDVILKQLPEAQELQKKLEDLQKLYIDTLTTKEKELKDKAASFKTKYEEAQKQVEAGTLKPDEIKALETELANLQVEIQKMEQEYNEYKQSSSETLLKTQSELFKPLKEKIVKVISDVAKELKYNYVLDKASDALIFGDKEFDITFKVLDKLK